MKATPIEAKIGLRMVISPLCFAGRDAQIRAIALYHPSLGQALRPSLF